MKSDKTKRPTDNKSIDELLSDLSLRLQKVNPGKIDSEIHRSLEEIGERYRIDRVALRRIDVGRNDQFCGDL